MTLQAALAPLFVQVALIGIFLQRNRALVDKTVRFKDIALREQNWPQRATQFGNAYHNQLEMPVLFYVLTLLVLFARQANLFFVLMSWVYVVLRIVHAFIHTTTNYLPHRALVFFGSCAVLLVMGAAFALNLYLF